MKATKANTLCREKAFVSSEFKDYNPRVEYHVAMLVKAIRKTKGKEVDGSKFMDNFVFDVMADLSFAHDAGMQDGTGDNSYMDFIHKYVALFSVSHLLLYACFQS
jgi:hypothetical protein